MPKKLTELEESSIVREIAIGVADSIIKKKYNIWEGKLAGIKKRRIYEIEECRKKMMEKLDRNMIKEVEHVSYDIFDLLKKTYGYIDDEKLKSSSAIQLATIMGILTDKYNILSGGFTHNVNLEFGNKEEMIKYLRGKKGEKVEGTGDGLKRIEDDSIGRQVMMSKRIFNKKRKEEDNNYGKTKKIGRTS